MNPGSISGRSSRTDRRGRWAVRARLFGVGVVGLLAMLAAARAHADWRAGPVLTRPPNDLLDVWGEGTYAVGYDAPLPGTRGGAQVVVDGGVVRELATHSAGTLPVGTFYQPATGCFVLLASDGHRSTLGPNDAGCGGINPNQAITSLTSGSGETCRRVKHASGGGSTVVVGKEDEFVKVMVSDAGIDSPGVEFMAIHRDDFPPLEPQPYAVTRMDGRVHFFVGLSSTAGVPRAVYGTNALASDRPWSLNETSLGRIQRVELFPAGTLPEPLFVVGTDNALIQGGTSGALDGGGLTVTAVPAEHEFAGLSMNVGAGSDAGWGFGMALAHQSDGGGVLRVMSPVPADSQTDAGTVWRTRVLPPAVALQMKDVRQVACHGAAFCVLTAPGRPDKNLFLYTNAAKPVLSVDGGSDGRVDAGWVEFDEDATVTLRLGATDEDQDPLRVTAELSSNLEPGRWRVGTPSAAAGEPVDVPVNTFRVCERTQVGSFAVRASDGWNAHDLLENVDVYVKHTRLPEPPRVNQAGGGEVARDGGFAGALEAGGAVLTLAPEAALTNDGCTWRLHDWRQESVDGPVLEEPGDGTARLRPPATFCEAAGRDFRFTLQSTDQGGLEASRVLTVHQRPWGAPASVFSASTTAAGRDAPAKTPVTIVPDTYRHACQTALGFPGVVTSWNVTGADGRGPGSGYSIHSTAGGPELQTFPVDAAGLKLSARECQPASVLTVRATHRMARPGGGADVLGPESELQVRFPPGQTELSRGVLDVSPSTTSDALSLSSALDCAAERGLIAAVSLTPGSQGGPTRTDAVTLPGEWTPPRDVACGSYTQRAVLKDAQGREGPVQYERVLELPGAGVKLEAIAPVVEVKATCGQGASVALSDLVRPAADFCQTPDYAWSQPGKPAFVQVSATDEPVRLATEEQGLDALIGQQVTVNVEARKGREQTQQPTEVLITTDPFVRVERSTELPAAAETGLVGVLVRLTNTTACDVSGVDYVEQLLGLSFVAGSAKLDGVPVDAGTGEDRLSVTLPRLEAGATRTLSYVARPHLLGEGRMEGTAHKNKVRISLDEASEPPREGCGCTSAGAAPMFLVLALLGGVTRRRRPDGGARGPTTRS